MDIFVGIRALSNAGGVICASEHDGVGNCTPERGKASSSQGPVADIHSTGTEDAEADRCRWARLHRTGYRPRLALCCQNWSTSSQAGLLTIVHTIVHTAKYISNSLLFTSDVSTEE